MVKKGSVALAALAAVGLLARRVAPKLGNVDWEKKFESMPDNAPPKWMFRNLTAIRENTERIIALLEGQPEESTQTDPPAGRNRGEPVEGDAP